MILQLLSILLLVGVAEAQQDLYTDCIHKAPDGTTYDICRMPDLRKILSESKPCELKMKEAMQEIDEILRLNHGLLMDREPGKPRICLNLSQHAYRQWERAMKECVK